MRPGCLQSGQRRCGIGDSRGPSYSRTSIAQVASDQTVSMATIRAGRHVPPHASINYRRESSRTGHHGRASAQGVTCRVHYAIRASEGMAANAARSPRSSGCRRHRAGHIPLDQHERRPRHILRTPVTGFFQRDCDQHREARHPGYRAVDDLSGTPVGDKERSIAARPRSTKPRTSATINSGSSN